MYLVQQCPRTQAKEKEVGPLLRISGFPSECETEEGRKLWLLERVIYVKDQDA